MAAATAVTTVAPAIANADVNNHKNVSVNEAVEKARKALNDKYDNEKANGITLPTGSSLAKNYLNSKYIVLVNKNGQGFDEYKDSAYANFKDYTADVKDGVKIENGNVVGGSDKWYVVDNATKLGTVLEANEDAEVAIIDKGSKDGSSVRTTDKKHYVSEKFEGERDQEVSLYNTAKELCDLADGATFVEELTVNGDNKNKLVIDKEKTGNAIPAPVTKIELKLTSGKTFTLEVNDDALDLKEALDKDGNTIKTDKVNTQDVLDKIVDFKLIANKDDLSVDLDINNGDTEVYTVDSKAVEESLELNNIYTREDGYTSEGKDFVNGLVNAKEKPYRFNFRGSNYELANKNAGDIKLDDAKIDKSGDGYKLTFNVDVRDANDTAVEKTLKFVVKGDKQRDLYDVLRDLKGGIEVVSGHFTKLAGSNRYATAVEVSAEQFKPDTAESVVIVGGKAQLDGLSAAPLASAKNAPILLADPNTGLNRDTIKEIDRACKSLKNKTVYIVGGEQSVPAKVAKQLEDEFGAVVIRVSGNDRMSTSLEVARRLNYDLNTTDKLFVVGRDGAADAMSISSVASIVTEENLSASEIDKEIKDKGNKIENKEKEIKNKEKEIENKEKEIKRIEHTHGNPWEKKKSIDKLKAEIKNLNKEIEDLNKEIENLKAKIKNLEEFKENSSSKISTVAPILVVDKNGLSREAREFVDKDLNSENGYLIGGEKSLSTQVLRDLKTAGITAPSRVSGDNRYDTNVEVIKEFYKNKDDQSQDGKIVVNGAIFASGENDYLVDAQTSGAFAAYKDNRFPIVLAGNKLTKDQIDLMKDGGVLDNQRANIYQVGGVVSSDVMKVVVDKLDL